LWQCLEQGGGVDWPKSIGALALLRLIALNANRINGFAPEELFAFQERGQPCGDLSVV
jgi:hypothetical protein